MGMFELTLMPGGGFTSVAVLADTVTLIPLLPNGRVPLVMLVSVISTEPISTRLMPQDGIRIVLGTSSGSAVSGLRLTNDDSPVQLSIPKGATHVIIRRDEAIGQDCGVGLCCLQQPGDARGPL